MRWHPWFVLLVLMALASVLVCSESEKSEDLLRPDEGVWLDYAGQVAQKGLPAFPELFKNYLADHEKNQYFPTPLRLTTIGVNALAVRLWGAHLESLQRVAWLSFLALLVLVFWNFRKCFGDWAAYGTTLLLAVSPLHLAMARQALSDSWVALLTVASLMLFLRVLLDGSRPRQWVWVSLLYSAAFLARESSIILIPVSWALMGWHAFQSRERLTPWPVLAVSLIPLAGAVLLCILAAGGMAPVWKTLSITYASVATNSYAIQYGSGPWFRYVVDGLLISPGIVLLYLLGLGVLLAGRSENAYVRAWMLVPVLFVGCLALGTKNIRYALSLEVPIRFGAFCFLWWITLGKRETLIRWFCLVLALAGIVWLDVRSFSELFVAWGRYDPVSYSLLAIRQFLPP